ncbi:MAG: hypothetical protein QNJ29_08015 [Rhizobiaceae bacterium]|nr:hypothetical protein [Rhizobiaceae bacterium]
MFSKALDPTKNPEADEGSFKINRQKLSFYVGLVALILPLTLFVLSATGLYTDRDSISHYYYSWILGDIFIVCLAFIGTFLIVYNGESNRETNLATAAGWCTFGIALFPTVGAGIEQGSAWGRVFLNITEVIDSGPNESMTIINPEISTAFSPAAFIGFPPQISGYVHYGFAVFVFGFLTWYCATVFKEPSASNEGNQGSNKEFRNLIYTLCSAAMFLAMLALAASFFLSEDGDLWDRLDGTFYAEAIALIAFGIAWMTRGRWFFWLDILDDDEYQLYGKARK